MHSSLARGFEYLKKAVNMSCESVCEKGCKRHRHIVPDSQLFGLQASCLGSAGAGASTMSMLSQLLEIECE
jgi:hypothetical protein